MGKLSKLKYGEVQEMRGKWWDMYGRSESTEELTIFNILAGAIMAVVSATVDDNVSTALFIAGAGMFASAAVLFILVKGYDVTADSIEGRMRQDLEAALPEMPDSVMDRYVETWLETGLHPNHLRKGQEEKEKYSHYVSSGASKGSIVALFVTFTVFPTFFWAAQMILNAFPVLSFTM